MLNEVLNRSNKPTALPDRDVAKTDLVQSFNNHYASIDANLSKKMSQPQDVTFKHFLKFFMTPTDSTELLKIILNLKSLYS